MTIDDEWLNFLDNKQDDTLTVDVNSDIIQANVSLDDLEKACSAIYISTKTKILFLSKTINIFEDFWKIPIIDYNKQIEGITKKQIKVSFENVEDYNKMLAKLETISNVNSKIISHIDNERFKHTRKISIGLSKKDLLNNPNKEKSAFYNCFVLFLRIYHNNTFKETHIKIFNTGKIEIPGIQSDEQLNIIIQKLLELLKMYIDNTIECNYKDTENVLINSNFNCGFYINREILYSLLRNKYNINAIYDPCSYPGIRCIYYHNVCDRIVKISYMIFRTGSILIVGKCDEDVLIIVYNFIKTIILNEYKDIFNEGCVKKIIKPQKSRSKFITVNAN
jgi:TATA-box binding protein (TBP) (component of TFIID and TFIIIB)